MANSKIDENGRPTATGVSNADGVTIIPLQANPNSHSLEVSNGSTGSDAGNNGNKSMIDENGVAAFTALSNANDGVIVELYLDSVTKKLLTKST